MRRFGPFPRQPDPAPVAVDPPVLARLPAIDDVIDATRWRCSECLVRSWRRSTWTLAM